MWVDVGGGKLPPAKKAGWVLFRKVATPGYGNAEAQLSSLLEAIVYRGTSEGPHGARLVASSSRISMSCGSGRSFGVDSHVVVDGQKHGTRPPRSLENGGSSWWRTEQLITDDTRASHCSTTQENARRKIHIRKTFRRQSMCRKMISDDGECAAYISQSTMLSSWRHHGGLGKYPRSHGSWMWP